MDLHRDLHAVARLLGKSPAVALAAAVSLALGIGAATVVFHVLDAVLLRPLPYPRPERLVALWESNAGLGFERMWVAYPNFRDFAAGAAGQAELAAYRPADLNLSSAGEPERLRGARITARLPEVLGVRPELGRTFTAAEEIPGNDRVLLLSHGFWRQRFQGDPGVLGRELLVDGDRRVVVGVMPPAFDLPREVAVWLPLAIAPLDQARDAHNLEVVARLRPGATRAVLGAALARTTRSLGAAFPATNRGWGVRLVDFREQQLGEARPALELLAWGVALLLLIAAGNVANLLAARMMARRGELLMRLALGEPRWRLARQLLLEAVLLTLLGTAGGLALAAGLLRRLPAVAPPDIPRLEWGSMTGADLGFAAAVALAAAALIGLYPALRGARLELAGALTEGALRSTADRQGLRFQRALVVAEVALSLVLLIATGLLVRSFYALAGTDPGLRVRGLVVAQLALPRERYQEPQQIAAFWRRVLGGVRALPQVAAAAATQVLPLTGNEEGTLVALPGALRRAESAVAVKYSAVTPGYLDLVGIPLLAGRTFDGRDGAAAPRTAVVSRNLARRLWPGADPLGRELDMDLGDGLRCRVVGVVDEVRQIELRRAAPPMVYLPFEQLPKRTLAMVVRPRGPLSRAELQQAVRAVDPEEPVYDVRRGEDLIGSALRRPRFWAVVLAGFSGCALLLTLVGVYGVLAHAVSLRTREMGIRMAFGAGLGDILGLVLGTGLRLGALGVVLGLGGSLLLTRVLRSLLYGVDALDPWTLGVTVPVLLACCLAASYVPARRAAGLEPVAALREG